MTRSKEEESRPGDARLDHDRAQRSPEYREGYVDGMTDQGAFEREHRSETARCCAPDGCNAEPKWSGRCGEHYWRMVAGQEPGQEREHRSETPVPDESALVLAIKQAWDAAAYHPRDGWCVAPEAIEALRLALDHRGESAEPSDLAALREQYEQELAERDAIIESGRSLCDEQEQEIATLRAVAEAARAIEPGVGYEAILDLRDALAALDAPACASKTSTQDHPGAFLPSVERHSSDPTSPGHQGSPDLVATSPKPGCDCDAPDTYYGPHREWCNVDGEGFDPTPSDESQRRERRGAPCTNGTASTCARSIGPSAHELLRPEGPRGKRPVLNARPHKSEDTKGASEK